VPKLLTQGNGRAPVGVPPIAAALSPLCRLLGLAGWLPCRWGRLPRPLFRSELQLDLEGDGVGVHLVRLGRGAENLASIRLRSRRKQDDGFDDKLSDVTLLCLTNESG
jgi:hypothetical protein